MALPDRFGQGRVARLFIDRDMANNARAVCDQVCQAAADSHCSPSCRHARAGRRNRNSPKQRRAMPFRNVLAPRHRLRAHRLCALFATALPVLASAAEPVRFAPTGLLTYDQVEFDGNDRGSESTDKVRSARLGFKVGSKGRWQLHVEHEFTDRSTPDAYLKWQLPRGQSLRVGQFKQPFLLEDATSVRQTPLMEASLLGSFAISRRLGAAYTRADDDASFNAALFGQRLDGKNAGLGAATRATWVLARSDAGLVHVGLGAAQERPDARVARFASKSETGFAPYNAIDTGSLAGTRRIGRYGGELLALHGPWSLQAELAQAHVTRDDGDFHGHGGYAMLGWSPGHVRDYSAGSVGAPELDGGPAWELFLRHSRLDLDDGQVQGGRQHDWAAGVTFHANDHLRLMANYIAADVRRGGANSHPRIAQLRVQLAF